MSLVFARHATPFRPALPVQSLWSRPARWLPILLVALALPVAATPLSGAVSHAAWITVDSECEWSGGWSARVGYLGPEGEDPPAQVTLTGLILGSTFELNLPNPYAGMSAELYDAQLTQADSLLLTGNWLGDLSGWFEGTAGDMTYSLQAEYTEGGFNTVDGDPNNPPDDSLWGWWHGTFSIRQSACPTSVPEPSTALGVITLGCGLALVRRRSHRSGDGR